MRFVIIAAVFLFALTSSFGAEDATRCASCHDVFALKCAEAGKAAHHRLAARRLGAADDEAFSDKKFDDADGKYSFFKDAEGFGVGFRDAQKGIEKVYRPNSVLGVEPLIQYVVDGERGAFQVMAASYDPDSKTWFNVFGDEKRNEGEWGHWMSKGMNWNSNCAYCHTTNFKKNYDSATDSYKSQWDALGINCTQCHNALPKDCETPSLPILKESPTRAQYMQVCASCHSRREELSANKFKTGDDYFDHFRPELPVQKGTYYADGKVKDESFMFGAFMMCRQYEAGLVCGDCHDWHSLKLYKPVDKNALCMNCHSKAARNFKGAPTIDEHAHSAHGDNDGNLCVNCHMPKTVYMQKDARYDHGFSSPDPVLSRQIGIPNACSQCHDEIDKDKPERNADWLVENFQKRPANERFLRKRARAIAVHRAHEGELSESLKDELLRLAKLEDIAAWRATLISIMSPFIGSDDVYNFALESLSHKSPLVRSAAISAISGRVDSQAVLARALADSNAAVRIDSAFALGGRLDRDTVAYSELMEYLDFNSDRPIGALKRADFAMRSGDLKNAREYALHALALEKSNPQLAREVAIMLFKAGDSDESLKILKRAKTLAPDSSEILFTLGLFYAEIGDMDLAVSEFENAVKVNPSFARCWYNLSVAYAQRGDFDKAIAAIDRAIESDPSNSASYNQAKAYYIKASK